VTILAQVMEEASNQLSCLTLLLTLEGAQTIESTLHPEEELGPSPTPADGDQVGAEEAETIRQSQQLQQQSGQERDFCGHDEGDGGRDENARSEDDSGRGEPEKDARARNRIPGSEDEAANQCDSARDQGMGQRNARSPSPVPSTSFNARETPESASPRRRESRSSRCSEKAEAIRQSWSPLVSYLVGRYEELGFSLRVATVLSESTIEDMACSGLDKKKVGN
jgi:hypothetical protein